MKKKGIIWTSVIAAVIVIGAGGYALMNNYLGNNVEIESVMAPSEENNANPSEETGSGEGVTAGAAVSMDELNGEWNIASGSKVYWSVTTSKETVNFVNEAVSGSWTVDLNDASKMTGEGVLDMTSLDSGNDQRDGHVKDREDLLAVAQYPEATFTATAITPQATEFTEATAVPLTIEGTLTVKGVEKAVTFDSNAMYKDGQLLLSGTTQVTFGDFGMTSPHTVVLETENDLSVQLELVLDQA
ncbi:YceI family protein [Paenibacillus harenae]|uniref:Polyisoprenoid-binding protein YceI n=1 Tax=Paenibacillus harenae TaxID=306543 RepID=A0ABT9U069_PAEHA|nr:YceI family protein [Paenibacillus harenae]MDQ0112647.1 polyisoprenoid-binding protein YceI [Paenibacillus harenae]